VTKRGRRTTGDDATSESPWELAAATPAIDVVPSELNAPVAQALDDDISGSSLARKASRGLSWSLLGTFVVKLGSFVMALIMARLLVPADFGAYAIALAATHFVMHVNDVGLIAATVQWRGRLEEMAATASTLALIFSGLLYAIFWFIAEPFARLSGAPEAAGVVQTNMILAIAFAEALGIYALVVAILIGFVF